MVVKVSNSKQLIDFCGVGEGLPITNLTGEKLRELVEQNRAAYKAYWKMFRCAVTKFKEDKEKTRQNEIMQCPN